MTKNKVFTEKNRGMEGKYFYLLKSAEDINSPIENSDWVSQNKITVCLLLVV